jgi:MoCo/4Fe-4S cofactor protein with predicted Tat translocation signal
MSELIKQLMTRRNSENHSHSQLVELNGGEGHQAEEAPLDLAAIQSRLGSGGKEYWRSLEELADTPVFQEFLHREFPDQASEWTDPKGRRQFLKLMGASLAFAGLAACGRQPKETIIPYVKQPEEIIPGKPLFFATAMPLHGIARALLVESHEGRPTKIEGNPQHPDNLGSSDIYMQASILDLYDPDRSKALTNLGEIRTWMEFLGAFRIALSRQKEKKGAGLRILTGSITSPTLAFQLNQILNDFPEAKWHQFEPALSDGAREGSRLAFGEPLHPLYHLENADIILSLDADFLSGANTPLCNLRSFAARRTPSTQHGKMNRLYVLESTPSITGLSADHRLAIRPSELEIYTATIATILGVQNKDVALMPEKKEHQKWVEAVTKDLRQHAGRCLIVAGEQQSALTHALAYAMNHALGNIGQTITFTSPLEAGNSNQLASIQTLAQDMDAGRVDLLAILGSNPVYNFPADLKFRERLGKVGMRVHLGTHQDETSELCHWHIPQTHYLESWGDLRGYDGTVSITQPLIAPLYNGKSLHELLAAFSSQPDRPGYDIVRGYWKSQYKGLDFEGMWRKSLHDGMIAGSALPAREVKFNPDWAVLNAMEGFPSKGTLELQFRSDPSILDGSFANNGWLQELPKPITKLTWDNAALISPATAQKLGLSYRIAGRGGEHGQIIVDMVELRFHGRKVNAPVWILPGQADDCVTVHLGNGRTRSGRVGTGIGFDAYRIRPSVALWHGAGVEIRKLNETYPLACTQFHHNMEGRDLIRSANWEEWSKGLDGKEGENRHHQDLSIYPEWEYKGNAWGMVIDLGACTGCNACVVACQAENNIPVVGKLEVMHGREMHWIRVDRYFKGNPENPEAHFQPVPCMQCEKAPCEVVCPVQATAHSAEGLNDMVYNRCVGTRYCSNNCPYKVRRFNFLAYQDWETPSLKMLRNPDVTVRSRGVMEKCTYCVQRINNARMDAEKENRSIQDGDVVTACQAACPAGAIVFGNLNDPKSRVAQLKANSRNYSLLGELNTSPRTTYLSAVKNPNPELG